MIVAPLIFAMEASGKGVGRFKVRAFHSHLLPESGRRRIGYPASQHGLAGVFYLGQLRLNPLPQCEQRADSGTCSQRAMSAVCRRLIRTGLTYLSPNTYGMTRRLPSTPVRRRNWFGCGAKISSSRCGRRSPISPWRADQFDNASGLRLLLAG